MESEARGNAGTDDVDEASAGIVRSRGTRLFDSVAIVGIGLIGGSLGLELKSRGLAERVIGVDRWAETVELGISVGAIDEGATTIDAVASADCVIFATPVGVSLELIEQSATFIRPGAIVTDVAGVKRRIVAAGERLFSERFVGGHPMAGSEANGLAAARHGLFDGAPWALVASRPERLNGGAAVRLQALVTALGAIPVCLSAERHDHFVALVSHLPHALSFAFAQSICADPDASAAVQMAGRSFHEFSRIAGSSPDLWADILIENGDRLIPAITTFENTLRRLRIAVEAGDRDILARELRFQLP